MEGEIVNKVANSSLEIFDLEDYYPQKEIVLLDISQWLYEGFILREKEFREALKNHDWSVYADKIVALSCTTDAILPSWAFMLVSSFLQAHAFMVVQGTEREALLQFYNNLVRDLDFSKYQNKATIIKGCSKKIIPEEIYVVATQKMMRYARSIMFGEACSAVPIFKHR